MLYNPLNITLYNKTALDSPHNLIHLPGRVHFLWDPGKWQILYRKPSSPLIDVSFLDIEFCHRTRSYITGCEVELVSFGEFGLDNHFDNTTWFRKVQIVSNRADLEVWHPKSSLFHYQVIWYCAIVNWKNLRSVPFVLQQRYSIWGVLFYTRNVMKETLKQR